MEIIGQTSLIKAINSMVEGGKLPHFIVLSGGRGSGRTMLSKYIAEQLGAELKIAEELKMANTREIIDDTRALSYKKLYLFRNVEAMNTQAENSLLKLVEEPGELCYIIMTVENSSSLLPTIQSRAKIFKMESYTDSELRKFTNRDDLIKMCKTPGLIKLFENCDADATLSFADKILKNVARVSVMNMLTILTYIDVDGKDETKYNNTLILKALEDKVSNLLMETREVKYLEILKKIQETRRALLNPSINKQGAFDDLLFTMRRALKIES